MEHDDYYKIGVLGNYLNESMSNPELPRILIWNGRIWKQGDERVVQTFFFKNKSVNIHKPFSISDWQTDEFSPTRDIRVSLIPFLRMGSVWGGRGNELRIANQDFLKIYQFELNEPQIAKPIQFHKLQEYRDCVKSLSLPRASANSYVLVYSGIEVLDGSKRKKGVKNGKKNISKLIIPCFEVARFYFFNSSTLTRTLLTPGSLDTNNNLLFVPDDNIDVAEGLSMVDKPKIKLRIFNKSDALTISRIAFSREARRSVSILQESILESGGHIASHFPFSSNTVLNARGIEFQSSGQSHLLVTELLSCSGHFPFKELAYTYDWPISENDPTGGSGNPDDKKPQKPRPKDPKMVEDNATSMGGIFRLTKEVSKKFPNAPRAKDIKYFEAEKKVTDIKKSSQICNPDGISDKEHTRYDGTKKRPKIEVTTEEQKEALEKNKLDRFRFFMDLLRWFNENGFETNVIEPFEENPSSYPTHLTKFKHKSWCYVSPGKARGIAIACLKHEAMHCYLFEHQPRNKREKIGIRVLWHKPYLTDSKEFEINDFETILFTFADTRGGLGSLRRYYQISSFRHINDIEKLCKNILAAIGLKPNDS